MLSSAADGYTSPMAGVLEELARALALQGLNLVWQLVVPGIRRPVGELSPAVVLTAATHDDADHHAMAQGFQVPVVDAFPGRDAFIAAAATAQVTHLADRGHRRIAYLTPPPGSLELMTGLRTAAAVAEARRRRMLKPRVVSWPEQRLARSTLVARLHAAGVTALCAYNDDVALAALLASHDCGLDVPDALSVIGVDDIPAAATAWPPLTSVRADTAPFATAMSEYLVALGRGQRATVTPLPVTFSVVHRDTT
jgi:DNA-binding LacI/PurR family transcriptional regulator